MQQSNINIGRQQRHETAMSAPLTQRHDMGCIATQLLHHVCTTDTHNYKLPQPQASSRDNHKHLSHMPALVSYVQVTMQ